MLIRITEDNGTSRKNVFQKYFIFLIKRSQRIFPAAFGVIILVVVGLQFFLNSFENKDNRTDALFNSLMAGNLYFADLGTNYFQSNRGDSYFLHYWSLSVEWQFYLLYGLFFLIFSKNLNSKYPLLVTNMFLIILSLIYFWINSESPQIYFSTLARAWELLLGSQIFLFNTFASKKQIFRIRIDAVFLSILFACVFFVDERTWYIGVIFGCIVAALILSNIFDLELVRNILNLRFFQHLGTISYSLYLAHWPVWLFLSDSIALGFIKKTTFAFFLTYTFGLIIFYIFEKPFLASPSRRKKFWDMLLLKDYSLVKLLIFAILVIQVLSISAAMVKPTTLFRDSFSSSNSRDIFTIQLEDFSKTKWVSSIKDGLLLKHLPKSLDPPISDLDREGYLNVFSVDCLINSNFISPDCSIGSKATSKRKLVVIGDSHAYSFLPAIQNSFDLKKWNVSLLVKANCAFALEGLGSNPQQCLKHRSWVFEQVRKSNPDLILVHDSGTRKDVFRWRVGMKKAIDQLPLEVPVIYVTPFPNMGDFHTCLKGASDSILGCITKVDPKLSNFRLITWDLFKDRNAVVIDPVPWVCYQERCPPIIDSKIVSVDGAHITPVFARLLAPLFFNEINPFLRQNKLE